MNKKISVVKTNLFGGFLGAIVGFAVAKEVVKTHNKWYVLGITVLGVFGGALLQSAASANLSQPTKETVLEQI